MKRIHPLSFGLGIVSGMIILFVVVSGMRTLGFGQSGATAQNGQYQQGQRGAPSLSRMAQRLSISEADLQKELDSGKTMQQIAAEHGVQFGSGGRGLRGGSGAVASSVLTASGALTASGTAPVIPSSSSVPTKP